jgi:hypothetical protein
VTCRLLALEFILISRETNYKRGQPSKRFSCSIACRVLQQCKSRRGIHCEFVAAGTFVLAFGGAKHEAGRSSFDQAGLQSFQKALTGFNRLARCGMMMALAAQAAKARNEAR